MRRPLSPILGFSGQVVRKVVLLVSKGLRLLGEVFGRFVQVLGREVLSLRCSLPLLEFLLGSLYLSSLVTVDDTMLFGCQIVASLSQLLYKLIFQPP